MANASVVVEKYCKVQYAFSLQHALLGHLGIKLLLNVFVLAKPKISSMVNASNVLRIVSSPFRQKNASVVQGSIELEEHALLVILGPSIMELTVSAI